MLQSIQRILTSRYFWIGTGFVLLIALSLLVGAFLEWSMVTRLLIIVGLLVGCVVFIVVELVRANRHAQQIENSITMQTDGQRQGPQKAKIDELRERLEKAIGTLKTSKLGHGRRSQNALHALPWYMFIGPSGVGKTTAIRNSGLNFPMDSDGMRGVGGTRNCDWFFSDEAILLDTAGRYMTEKEDEEEWHAFLDMLKNHRSRRPINGVIVGMSIDELVDAEPDEIEWHANTIRRRISELVDRLGVRFPVYVVFTKCDLLQGFVEFFGDLTRGERQQIWGATLTEEQRAEHNPRTLFETEFDRLYDALVDARLERLSQSLNQPLRRQVYVFPFEFAAAKENLSLFIDQLFQDNPYQENPAFRGFYFTSGTQEGAPIDRAIQSISDQFDLPVQVEEKEEEAPQTESKSYFIKDLFTETIIPDQYLVEQTSQSARRGQLLRWGVGVASALALGVCTIFAGQALVRSTMDLNQIEEVARDVSTVQWAGTSTAQNLDALEQLRTEVVQLESYEQNPPLLRWGLYRGGQVLGPTRELFYRKVRPLVRVQFQEIERRLEQVLDQSGSLVQDERLTYREHLRAYLLLSEEVDRLRKKQERAFLRQYLATIATAKGGRLSTAQLRKRKGQLESQLARYVTGMGEHGVPGFEARSALIQDVRRRIYRKPTIDNLYATIRQEGLNSLQPVRLADLLQQSGGEALFASQPEVPGFFTKQGWNSYVEERIEEEAQNPGQGDWVLGDRSEQSENALKDEDQIAKQLRTRYFKDYSAAWKHFLRNVEYRSFGRLREAARALNDLGNPYSSPLLYVLAHVSRETQFAASMTDKAQGQLKDEAKARLGAKVRQRTRSRGVLQGNSDENKTVHPVTRRFKGLHLLDAEKAANGKAASALTRSLEALGRVGSMVNGLANNPQDATDVAARVLNGNSTLRSALTDVRNNLDQIDPVARQQLFDGALLQVWTTIVANAQQHLNERWRQDVYRVYQKTLKDRYPFAQTDQDAALADVERFFHPQNGVIASFEKKHLAPFLHNTRREPKTWEGQDIRMSSQTRRVLEMADRISKELFEGGSLRLRFELTPELPEESEAAPTPSQVFIRAHGTSQEYQMGYQPNTSFVWPGERGARIVLTTRKGTLGPKQHEGPWAWFRLIADADVNPRARNEYRVRWPFERAGQYSITARYDLQSEHAQRLFTNPNDFFRLRVPKTLD